MRSFLLIGAVSAAALLAGTAGATELLTNGGFETGDFTGWTANVEANSAGNLFVVANTAGNAPLSNNSYQADPSGGNFIALTDQSSPGSYSLTQSFTADGVSDITVSFDLFANDYGINGIENNSTNNRDFNEPNNENAEVDILTGAALPFTINPSDIVAVLYGPGADNLNGNPNPFVTYNDDLGVLAAGTYQIRFAETDNDGFFNMGVDNVSVDASGSGPAPSPTPEPATLALLGAGLIGLTRARRSRN